MAAPTTPSFIPHDTAVVAPSAVRRSRAAFNDLLLLCSIVLLVTSIALAVGVFLYQKFLTTEAASKLVQLQRAKAAFEPSLVQELTRLDDRMHAAEYLLGEHMAPTQFFSALQTSTLQTVSFSSLVLQAPDPQHVTITMRGSAQSVNSIALQADLFSKNGVITSPIFSDISRQEDGVHFALSALVNPSAVNYEALANGVQTGTATLPLQQLQAQQQSQQSQTTGQQQRSQQGQADAQQQVSGQAASPFGGGAAPASGGE